VTETLPRPPMLQDMPPPTHFPKVRFERRIPNSGPSGLAIMGGCFLVMGYGFYMVGQGNLKRRAQKEEVQAARATLLPLLQAEEDRKYAARLPRE
jgi:NADH dehydrogenase (ubiquinone) 1 alpha subcomplex subunit 13